MVEMESKTELFYFTNLIIKRTDFVFTTIINKRVDIQTSEIGEEQE